MSLQIRDFLRTLFFWPKRRSGHGVLYMPGRILRNPKRLVRGFESLKSSARPADGLPVRGAHTTTQFWFGRPTHSPSQLVGFVMDAVLIVSKRCFEYRRCGSGAGRRREKC